MKGKTSTDDLDVDIDFRSEVSEWVGDKRRRTCEVDVGTKVSRMETSFESEREEGIGSV